MSDENGHSQFDVLDPANGELIATVPDVSPEDGLAVLERAAAAQAEWAAVPAWERGEILRRGFEAMRSEQDRLAELISRESGKALSEGRAEVAYAADFLRWFAEEPARIRGSYAEAPSGGFRMLTTPVPVGPCLLITPWNFPLAMATRKVGPALAAGCTAILKPASLTPLTSIAFADLMRDAGLPEGALSVVTSRSSGALSEALIGDERLRKLSFTGSTEVGKGLLELCARRVMRTSMELGGNAPLIVFDDCDLERAVEGAVLAKLRNSGQSCIAANRIYAQKGIAEELVAGLTERFNAIGMGPALDGGQMGPLIDAESPQRMEALVDDAVTRGSRVVAGGERPAGPGYFYPPTLLWDVADDSRAMREEIFGPVAPVRLFEREDEVLQAANATAYGLVAYVFTQDIDRALRVSERLDVGMVGINRGIVSNAAAPFGGVKESGLGREGGEEGIDEYLELKYVAIDGDASTPQLGTGPQAAP